MRWIWSVLKVSRSTHRWGSPCYTMKCYLLCHCAFITGRYLMWAPAFISHCGPSQRRLGAWAAEWRQEAPFFFLWMLSLTMNECNSGKCAPWTEEETPKSSRAPEGICLWQMTSPTRGVEPADHRVPPIKRVQAWSHAPASWSFCFCLFPDFNLKGKVNEKWCCR